MLVGAVDSSYDTQGTSGFERSCTWKCRRLITDMSKIIQTRSERDAAAFAPDMQSPAYDLCYCSVVILISEGKPVKVSQQTTG